MRSITAANFLSKKAESGNRILGYPVGGKPVHSSSSMAGAGGSRRTPMGTVVVTVTAVEHSRS